jgi:phosphatidylinositol glycan class B
MAPCVLLIALALRSLALLLPHTYFQPDEFYQAFEPAYARVFGSGYITWEWRDLPANGGDGWWDTVVAGGRLRGWAWPGVFVLVYQAVRALGAERFIVSWRKGRREGSADCRRSHPALLELSLQL